MIELRLFLGFPIGSELASYLSASNPYLWENLILIKHQEEEYIGKLIGSSIDREGLHNAEANVYSLLSKLVPNFSFYETSLILFPYPHE